MFYYRGRKKKIAGMYPEPEYDTIIEPFAGSAAYSLHGNRWEKNVIIRDINPRTIGVWKYLIRATKNDIDNLPNVNPGDDLRKMNLSPEEHALIGYHCSVGADQNTNIVSKFHRWIPGKKYISENIYKIKHWTIELGQYSDIENICATWFIDPPYEKNGKNYQYPFSESYLSLGSWCRERIGQCIVCEEFGANWLPFRVLTDSKIQRHKRVTEVVWTNSDGYRED